MLNKKSHLDKVHHQGMGVQVQNKMYYYLSREKNIQGAICYPSRNFNFEILQKSLKLAKYLCCKIV